MEKTVWNAYNKFRCIADKCLDSCCQGWEVDVDEETAAYYRSLEGDLGDRLRRVLQTVEGESSMILEDGRCPMWREDGLCHIQAQLGEEALCHTCHTFPRLRHDYGDFIERGLELSCPEAARMILCAAPAPFIEEQTDGGEAEYDQEAMEVLLRTRKQVLEILSDDSRSVGETLALALLYGYQAQGELDGDAELPFDSQAALESATEFSKAADEKLWLEFFRSLEILTPEWKKMLENPAPAPWSKEFLALARYFVERYWLQAVSDYDLACRVKFTVIACLTVKLLGGDIYRTAQLFSKEIENNTDNVEAILDAAYAHPAFTDDKLLGALMET